MSSRQSFHIIFRKIVLEAAQIWRELAPHYFSADCFGGSSNLAGTATKQPTQPHNCTGSDLAGTGSKLFSGGLFWRELKLSGNWHERIISYVQQEENLDSTRKFVQN
jgi:hypothetical protein